jgi:prophage regulatory protein
MATRTATPPATGGKQFPSPEALPLDGFSRWNDFKQFMPFCRETLRKRELDGRFPRRHHLSQRCAAWSNRELHRWFADPVGYRAEVAEPTTGSAHAARVPMPVDLAEDERDGVHHEL